MKRYLYLLVIIFTAGQVIAQPKIDRQFPEFNVLKGEVASKLRFLSSDELKGRYTGSEGNNIAARFIAAHLEAYGFESPQGAEDYYQLVPFVKTKAPKKSTLELHKTEYVYKDDYIMMNGGPVNLNAEAVFAGHGWVDEENKVDDYAGLDVKGKVVFVLGGRPDVSDPRSTFRAMSAKQHLAEERGAVALFEIYTLNFPWEFFKRYFGSSSMRLESEEEQAASNENPMPYGWIKNFAEDKPYQRLKEGKKVKIGLMSSGFKKEKIQSQNVIGVLEGTDPGLRDEYVLLTAHYDHVGVGKQGGGATTEQDSIFNGARDNAMGTVAMLTAAKALSIERPKRSVIVLAVTGEEIGLLGSSYYADHPVIPLEKTIFNLNTDGAGYNDTDYVSVFGYGRTATDDHIKAAAEAVGLEVFPDPAPQQNLFDRSDNVSFARKGVPALTVSPGMTSFDEQINKYYHQVTDEANSVDMDYFLKFCQVYAYLARLVADDEQRPQWREGDKYEEAGKELYRHSDK
jgi:hypothetical protein